MGKEGERDELVMELVSAAMEQTPETRESYLRSACGNDADLFSEVAERVDWEQRMGGFLRQSVAETLELFERPFEPGALVAGRFRVLNEIGRGGMGVVYEAYDEKLDRRVALKTAVRGYDNRLPPETRAAREVSHFNVCKVHELHSAQTEMGEVEFLTMEFISGETLSARIRRSGGLPLEQAREIALQISAGLAQAHRQGVVHGDLKCGNVILTELPGGGTRAVITDFGLASLAHSEGETNASQQLRGSFDYMAPELFSGVAPSRASDLYALGVMLHEMITGSVPAPVAEQGLNEDATTLTLTRTADRRRPVGRRCQKLPRPWGAMVRRCLEFDPKDRFSTADEVIERLEAPPGNRRWLLAIPAAAAVVAAVLWLGRDKPGPPVRLAVLPIAVEGAPIPEAAGLGVELADRLSGARRGFVVIPPGEAQRNRVDSPERAKTVLAATHVLRTRMRNSGGQLIMEASVVESGSGSTLQGIRGSYGPRDVALMAKALTATVTGAFRLRARVPMEVLAAAAYPDYVQGLSLLKRDESSADEAIPFLLKASKLDPGSALVQAALAEAYLQKFWKGFGAEWMDQASQAITKARSLNADSPPVLLADGYMNQLHGWYEQAAREYSRAAELAPGSADAWSRLAQTYSAMNQPDQAIATYRKALDAQPDYYLPYLDLGRFYRRRLQFSEAEQIFRKVTSLAPGLAVGQMLLGLALEDENRSAEAEQALLTSVGLQETAPALIDLGALYYSAERYAEAERCFERALTIAPPTAPAYADLADAYRHLGRLDDAVSAYRSAEALAKANVIQNPSDASARSLYAYILAHLGRTELSNYEVAQALGLAPRDAAVMRDAVLIFEVLGERERSLEVLREPPPQLLQDLNSQPDVRSLQQDSSFQELLSNKKGQK